MERKRIEKLVVLLLIGILMPVSLFPFHIKADTFEWYHVTGELMSSQLNNELTINNTKVYEYLFNYQYHVKFDDSYLGYAQISITQEYYDDTDNNGGLSVNTLKTYTTPVKTYYVNSDEVVVNLSLKVRISVGHIQTNYDPCKNFTPSVFVSNANVTKIGLLTSIDEVIDILSNIYTSVDAIEGLSTDQLSELENIVSNTSLANQYLDTITKLRQFNVPIESLSYCYTMINRYPNQVVDVKDHYYFQYPIFQLNATDSFVNLYLNNSLSDSFDIIFGTNLNVSNTTQFLNKVSASRDFTINSFENLLITDTTYYMRIIKVNISSSPNTNSVFKMYFSDASYFIPIILKREDQKIRYSTDFALIYGLSNQLLDDLHIIANGTSQSSSASGSLDQTTSQFSDDANDLVTIEESFNNSMNQSLQSVNPTFNMGSSFLTSANWVSQQFNRIVNNTPFASLITFGLTLGLGLLIIGKVRK